MSCLREMALRAVPLAVLALTAAAAHAQSVPQLQSRDGVLVLPNVQVRQGPVAQDAAPALARSGMRAFKDHETGQLRAPTPEEQIAVAAEPVDASTPAVVRRAANGALMASAGSNTMSYSIAQRTAKGQIETVCVTGEDAASKALAGKPAKNAKEHRHAAR